MVPQTVMVAPEGVRYERIPARYGVRERVEMVAPARLLRGGCSALRFLRLLRSGMRERCARPHANAQGQRGT